MRRFKKAVAVAISMAMLISMAACGKKDNDNNSENASATSVEKTTEEASAGDATTEDASGNDASDDTTELTTEDDYDENDWTITTEEGDASDDQKILDGQELFNINFDDNDLAGYTTYMNGGDMTLEAKDGQMVANIKEIGSVEHACQAYWDGFGLIEGVVYTLSFDVSCDKERTIDWRVQLNGGDYHAYATDRISIGPDVQTITADFTMGEASDPSPRMVFNIGNIEGTDAGIGEHSIFIDNLKLVVKDCSNASFSESVPKSKKVKVNQIGYAPNDTKIVVTSSPDDRHFKVVNVETGEEVFVGKYPDKVDDVALGGEVRVGDFSEVKEPGKYKVISAPSGESYEFEIGDKLYDDVYKDAVLMLYKQRCGVELDASIAGTFAHGDCHTGNAIVYGSSDKNGIDVSGGWHDAGDYGRYVVPGAKTIQDLFLAYEDYGIDTDGIGIPESGNNIPDLLDEAKFELDWMLKMQDSESGGVYHKVSGLNFPGFVMPEEETEQLYLAPISYAATADFVAVMAKASVLYKDIDADFAATCLEASKKAFEYGEANFDDGTGYSNPDDIATGAYDDKKLKDERLWASTELYIATGDEAYLNIVKEVIDGDFSLGLGWAAMGTYALYDLAKADNIDANIKQTATEKLIADADTLVDLCKQSALGTDQAASFVWGSNMRVADTGCELLMANKISPKEEYVVYAQRQRDYLFGANGPTYCFVTGYGDLSPSHVHHRPSQAKGATMPGMLVGGPDNALEDPYAVAVLTGAAPANAYVDNEQSYSCNEITIYWNSPLIHLLSGLE